MIPVHFEPQSKMIQFSQTLSSSLNFSRLALFVCHLFIDGHFRTGCILHDPKTIDISQIISEVDSICPQPIPWLSIDINKPFSSPWQPNEQTDHILQLNLIDLENSEQSINNFKDLITFYHLFVFYSNDETNLNDRIIAIENTNSSILSKSIAVSFNSTSINLLNNLAENGNFTERIDFESENLFDTTFKAYDENWAIGIQYKIGKFPMERNPEMDHLYGILDENRFFANFFCWNLKANFMNISFGNSSSLWKLIRTQDKSQKIYKELSSTYEMIENNM